MRTVRRESLKLNKAKFDALERIARAFAKDKQVHLSGADFRTRRSAWNQVVTSIKEQNCGGQKNKIRRD
ncbi:MAG TPA: hypothetical protein VJ810_17680 [Blastocatellia bacterium]|nr:hypothetical protein [Blastocatellia bacterium]